MACSAVDSHSCVRTLGPTHLACRSRRLQSSLTRLSHGSARGFTHPHPAGAAAALARLRSAPRRRARHSGSGSAADRRARPGRSGRTASGARAASDGGRPGAAHLPPDRHPAGADGDGFTLHGVAAPRRGGHFLAGPGGGLRWAADFL